MLSIGRDQFNGFLGVTGFCLAIALLLYGLGLTSPFMTTLVISLSIGWSVSGAGFLLKPWIDRQTSPLRTALVITPIGLFAGLAIAGLINDSNALAYITLNDAALIISVFFAVVGYLIFEARSRLAAARAELLAAEAIQERQEKALLEAELKLLQAQIEPHFLFNTLSNVIGLVHTNPQAAEQTLIDLTVLLRSALDGTREVSTRLEQELAVVAAFLGIHKIRMQDRLRFNFEPDLDNLPAKLCNWRLPPLLIQPLVENAIQHGIDPSETGGEVSIRVEVEGDKLLIEVADSGIGINTMSAGSGTGLTNVRRRLQTAYHGEASLDFEENASGGVTVRLLLPEFSQ